MFKVWCFLDFRGFFVPLVVMNVFTLVLVLSSVTCNVKEADRALVSIQLH